MRVRFKGKDPRAGREIDLDAAAAKRYIRDGLADEVKAGDRAADQAADTGAAEAAAPARGAPAKKATRGR